MGDLFQVLVIVGLVIVIIGAVLAWLNNAMASMLVKAGLGLIGLAIILYLIFYLIGRIERVG